MLLFFTLSLQADIISPTGSIKFNTGIDNQEEMILNSTGLGIGTTPSSNLHVNGNAIVSQQVFIGGSSGSSNLNLNGTMGFEIQMISSNTTLDQHSIILADSSSDNITLTLPYAGNVTGRQYTIKKTSTLNSVWVSGGGNLIDDTNLIELPEANMGNIKFFSDGTQWFIIDQNNSSATVAADNLVGWWKLDETSGVSSQDSSSQNISSTLSGGFNYSTSSVTGKVSSALDFDGSDDRVNLGTPDVLKFSGNNHFSLTAWVNIDAITDAHPRIIAVEEGSGDNGYRLYYNTGTNAWNFELKDSGAEPIVSHTEAIIPGEWIHFACVYDGTQVFLYRNTISNTTTRATDWTPDYSAITEFSIGGRGGSNSYDGQIDDVRIYNKALTPAEVTAIYNNGR